MSELVNGSDAPNVIAGEYVLGTLDGDERMHVQSLLASDAEFAAKVKVWERRLGELHLMVEPVEPDRAIWERIKTKLPGVQQQTQPAEPQQAEPEPAEPEPAEPQQAEPEPAAAQPVEPAPAEHVSAEHAPAAPADDALARRLDAAIAAISEAASAAPAELASSEGAAADASVAPSPPVTEPLAPPMPPLEHEEHRVRRRLAGWRAFAVLMILLVLAMAALVAAWRFAPDRVPPALQPVALLRLVGVNLAPPSPPTPVRRPLPPGSQFDE